MDTEYEIYQHRQNGGLATRSRPWRLIDLFAGAGGMTLGFTSNGHSFKPVWANDFDRASVETYNANFGQHCHHGDIVDLLADPHIKIPKADVVIGGPPCQGFSLLNKKREHDPRKQLWIPYLEVVERSGADVFVMENVPQLIDSPEFADIVTEARVLGFEIARAHLVAADYGVPQMRKRAIIIGARKVDPNDFFPPKRTHHRSDQKPRGADYAPDCKPWRTVRDALKGLRNPKGTDIRTGVSARDTLHFGRNPTPISLERYKTIPPGGNRFDLKMLRPDLTPQCWIKKTSGGTDLFGRLWWDRPAVTIRTEFFKPEKGRYLHPEENRPITHREAARFQSFPDEFKFAGTKIEIAKQIGNAVPPQLAARVADCVYAILMASRGVKKARS